MDSYEKLRKMSEISRELKKHGLAADSSEAIRKAEEMVMKNNVGETEVYVTQDRFNIAARQKEEETHMDGEKDIMASIRSLQSSFNEKVDALSADFNLMRGKINEIIGKINELEGKVNTIGRHEVQATLGNSREREERRSEPKEAKPDKSAEHGIKPEVKTEYTPQDVAIDRVFYTGKK